MLHCTALWNLLPCREMPLNGLASIVYAGRLPACGNNLLGICRAFRCARTERSAWQLGGYQTSLVIKRVFGIGT
eukprot:6490665-Amphidinium_carterae.3